MSIATEIERLQYAKDDIKQALLDKNITNTKQISGVTIDYYGDIIYAARIIPKPSMVNQITLNSYGRITKVGSATNNIGAYYRGCRYLMQFTWTNPSRVTSLSNYAFEGCSSLPSFNIPSGITAIPKSCFAGCSALTGVTNPNATVEWTSIGNNAFSACTNLVTVAGLGSGTTSIGQSAFQACRSLTDAYIPNVTTLNYYTFSGCRSLTSVTITNVTMIGEGAFESCSGLTSISIPSVTMIASSAFRECSGLTSITIPDSCTDIYGQAFQGCAALQTVDVGTGITSLQNWGIFAEVGTNTASGTTFIFRANQMVNAYAYAFENASVNEIYVPDALVSSYQADNQWLQVVGNDTTKIKPLSDYVSA